MAKKIYAPAEVRAQKELIEGIMDLTIATEAAYGAVPGQYMNLYLNDEAHLLPRPISICEIDRRNALVRLIYRVVGKGTKAIASLVPGDRLDVLGPLGNGFPLNIPERNAMLIGGGLGIPPMLELAREFPGRTKAVLGFTDETFLTEDFSKTDSEVYIATEKGTNGTKGNVIGAIMENNLGADVIYACGPKAMLSAVKMYAQSRKIRCYVSMEERMACGVGACLGCVVKMNARDPHSGVKRQRACVDGPVFDAAEVDFP